MLCFYFLFAICFAISVFWVVEIVTEIWSAYARYRQWWIQSYEHSNAYFVYDDKIIKLSAALHMQNMCMIYSRLIAKNLFIHLFIIKVDVATIADQHMLSMSWICTYMSVFMTDINICKIDAEFADMWYVCVNILRL